MRAETHRAVDDWWRDLFGVGDLLWSAVTVTHPPGRLGAYPGWHVAWRDDGVHVSAPSTAAAAEVASLTEAGGPDLHDPAFWRAFAQQRGLSLLGPSTHHVLDVAPGCDDDIDPDVVEVDPSEVADLRDVVTDVEWSESGLTHSREVCFGLRIDGELVAVAGLDDWDGAPRDTGVLVTPDHRGRGFGTRVGARAAAYAVRAHGRARWRALTTNVASIRTAERLGFEPFATQLAVRPATPAATSG